MLSTAPSQDAIATIVSGDDRSDSIKTGNHYNFKHVGGRRFHGNPNVQTYILPNDNEEQARLDKLQFMICTVFGRSVMAPINPKPERILDCGTGSGRWVVDVAQEFPTAHVLGIDISPVTRINAPNNCEFQLGNINHDLAKFDAGSFDLVHSRFVMGGVTRNQWPAYIAEIFRTLKPGTGWAQCSETSLPAWESALPEESLYLKYTKMMERVVKGNNYIIGGEHLEKLFIDAGFVDVKVIAKVIDIGNWRHGRDPAMASAWDAAMSVYADPIPAVGMVLAMEFPDETERREFGEATKREFVQSNYPLYTKV